MKLIIAIIIATTTMLTACAKPITNAPKLDSGQLNAERRAQQQMLDSKGSAKAAPVAMQSPQLVRDRLTRVAARIGKSGTSTCWQMFGNNQPCSFDFQLVEDDKLNAWADGKSIYITPTMISFASTDEELANVLAHEYAHNVLKHPQSTMQNVTMGSVGGMLLDVLAQSQGVNTGGALSKLGGSAAQLHYSIDFEKEADYVGLYILARADYNANGASEFWRKFTVQTGGGVEGSATHPSNPERTLAMRKTADEIQAKKASGQTLLPNLRPQ